MADTGDKLSLDILQDGFAVDLTARGQRRERLAQPLPSTNPKQITWRICVPAVPAFYLRAPTRSEVRALVKRHLKVRKIPAGVCIEECSSEEATGEAAGTTGAGSGDPG